MLVTTSAYDHGENLSSRQAWKNGDLPHGQMLKAPPCVKGSLLFQKKLPGDSHCEAEMAAYRKHSLKGFFLGR